MYDTNKKPHSQVLAKTITGKCLTFLRPLLNHLARSPDLRLVRTLANTVTSIVRHRQRSSALLLSELGAFLTDPEHAPAGTKRLANLVHSQKWSAKAIDDYLLEEGRRRMEAELPFSPEGRILKWEARLKLLAIVSLVYAFLIDLLGDSTGSLLKQVLAWAHRTGRQSQSAWRPLYRLRIALQALWQRQTPWILRNQIC